MQGGGVARGAIVDAVRGYLESLGRERFVSSQEVIDSVSERHGYLPHAVRSAIGRMIDAGALDTSVTAGGRFVQLPGVWRGLTRAERAVAVMICDGLERGEMAAKAGVARKTIDTHRRNILVKYGVGNEIILMRYAIARAWVVVPAAEEPCPR